MATAKTTDWLTALLTILLTPNTSIVGLTEGSYASRTQYPWAFVTCDGDESPRRYVTHAIEDADETLSILIIAKDVDLVRKAQEEVALYLLKRSNWTATLPAYGVYNIQRTGMTKPMKMNPESNNEYGGEVTFTVQVRYQSA